MRATKKQNEIIKAHFDAFESNNFTPSDGTHILSQLKDNKTSVLVWQHIVEYNVSVTSQLMMSNDTFRHISDKAKADIRKGFIRFLNRLNIK